MPLSVDELSELDEGDPTRTSGGSGSYIFDAVAKGGAVFPESYCEEDSNRSSASAPNQSDSSCTKWKENAIFVPVRLCRLSLADGDLPDVRFA